MKCRHVKCMTAAAHNDVVVVDDDDNDVVVDGDNDVVTDVTSFVQLHCCCYYYNTNKSTGKSLINATAALISTHSFYDVPSS